MTESRALPADAPCPNCGERTPGRYCPQCGQRRIVRRLSLRSLLADVFEDELSLSGALPRTLSTLLRPGLLARDYFEGRIARYIPPFRLYLIASFVYFLVLSLSGGGAGRAVVRVSETEDPAAAAAPADSVRAAVLPDSTEAAGMVADTSIRRRRPEVTREQLDSLFAEIPLLPPNTRADLADRAYRMTQLAPGELRRIVSREFLARAPIAVFLLVPAFAALLALLYRRTRRYYVEHFVFSLHLHAFAFIVFALLELIGRWPVVRLGLWLWLMAYAFSALRVVYGQSRARTALKLGLLGTAYGMLLGLTLLGTLLITLLLLPV